MTATAAVPPDAEIGYAPGRTEAETGRLIRQHQLYGPLTRQFLIGSGITAGMKVLDVGCGAGDVALLLADLVGPQGQVLGLDTNADILDTARERVRAAGWTTVTFREGSLPQPDVAGEFDAVVGRWVLMYVPDPAALLRDARAALRPGGIVAFQEGDIRSSVRAYPPAPLHEQMVRLTTPPPGAPGPDIEMGLKLCAAFVQAGLQVPFLRHDAPVGGGETWPGYAYLADTVRSLLPFLVQVGAAAPDQVDLETLEDRLRAEVVQRNGIQILPPLIGAWARV